MVFPIYFLNNIDWENQQLVWASSKWYQDMQNNISRFIFETKSKIYSEIMEIYKSQATMVSPAKVSHGVIASDTVGKPVTHPPPVKFYCAKVPVPVSTQYSDVWVMVIALSHFQGAVL